MNKSQLKQLIKECINEMNENNVFFSTKLDNVNKVKIVNIGINFSWGSSNEHNDMYDHCKNIHKNDIKLYNTGRYGTINDYKCVCDCEDVNWNQEDNPYKKTEIRWTIDSSD